MKILIAIKQTASLEEDFEFRPDGKDVDEDFLTFDLNEWDDYSLEEAMQIKETSGADIEVVVVTVGPERADEALRKCLAKGADRAIRVWDDAFADADPIATARVIASVVKREAPEMIFAGVQASDHAFSSTGIALSAFLDLPHAAVVSNLKYTPGSNQAVLQRELEGGMLEEVEIECPAVLTIQLGINKPRYASLRGIKQAASKPIELLDASDLGLDTAQVGAAGSLSRVRRMYVPEKGRATMIEGTAAEQAAQLADIIRQFKGA